jgi:hypothetical protein
MIKAGGLSRSELMKSLRQDALKALTEQNPTVSRQVLRNNARILAKDWYRKIQSGEIQFGVRVENGRDGEQEGHGDDIPAVNRDRKWIERRKRIGHGFRKRAGQ